jgi:hypothetical protein
MVISSAVGTGSLSFEYLTAEVGYKVTMESDGLLVAAATDLAWDRLHAYLDSLAKDWRGWYGVRELSALPPRVSYSQPALTIAASTDRAGHFALVAELGRPHLGTDIQKEVHETHVGVPDSVQAGAWRARLVVVLETWQLDGLVDEVLRLRPNQPRGFY